MPAFQILLLCPSPFAILSRNLIQLLYSFNKLHSFTAELSGVKFANDCFPSAEIGGLSAKSDWDFVEPMSLKDS